MRAAAAVVIAVLAGCGGGSDPAGVDAAPGGSDAARDPDAAVCVVPEDPTTTCDPDASPLPNPSCLADEPGASGCPDGMALIAADPAFCIDRYEATIDGASPYRNPGATPGPASSTRDAVPQAYISGTQAAASCAAAGKRLCSDAEWLRACRGPDENVYPYGDTRMPGVCNDARAVHPAVEYFMTTDPIIFSMLGHPCLDQLPSSLDRAGENPGCVTGEGVYDMMGNLHEWTAAAAGTFRGGFYVDTMINGDGCLYATTAHDVAHWDYSTGFRCCADR
jgi:sulfatase modifying factor 1